MKRPLRWVVGIVACAAAGGAVGILGTFLEIREGWIGVLVVIVTWGVIKQFKESGWW